MITFQTISWSNFLSTGNVPNKIKLNTHGSTLITGKNGEGKSTILCALTFALFGRPFRNVNKNQLINSINKKNCLVEVTFTINGNEYIVKRGIKPNVFEIYCNGDLINQDAALKDYQEVLEKQILKLNYKTFTQVVILGSATFVPFMQLTTVQRREVIEDILDIKIFSLMNQILKEKIAATKTQMQDIESSISSHKTKIQTQKKLIDTLEANRQNVIAGLQSKIDANNLQIDTCNNTITELHVQRDGLTQRNAKKKNLLMIQSKVDQAKASTATKINSCQTHIDFFSSNETCPSCSQSIQADHKEKILSDLQDQIDAHQSKLNEVTEAIEKLNTQLEVLNEVADQLHNVNIEISTHLQTITILKQQNTNMASEIANTISDSTNLNDEKMRMRTLAEEAIEFVTQKSSVLDTQRLHDVASALLKDTGIKTAIIREYLPVMNKLINKYLTAMDFYVHFELDDSFQETIKSRGRDVFTYDSFSEGEKRRLDLAILFTWRQIAKMKNSVNTNIMILDEILDGALDGAGIDYFLSIMNQFGDNTNVFVISHKVDQMIERFDQVIRVEKKNDFSVISSS